MMSQFISFYFFLSKSTMIEKRSYSKTFYLDEERFMVTGGSNLNRNSRTTEIYDKATGKFIRGPDLPEPMSRHCAIGVIF